MESNKLKNIFLIDSFLLQYPDEGWLNTLEDVREEAAKLKNELCVKPILKFLKFVEGKEILDLAELYVRTFDFNNDNTLHVSYHQYKDTPNRGKALLDIKRLYFEAGIVLKDGELPDFLPVILEFAAFSGNKSIVLNYVKVLHEIYMNLNQEKNPYLNVLKSVLLAVEEESLEEPPKLTATGGADA